MSSPCGWDGLLTLRTLSLALSDAIRMLLGGGPARDALMLPSPLLAGSTPPAQRLCLLRVVPCSRAWNRFGPALSLELCGEHSWLILQVVPMLIQVVSCGCACPSHAFLYGFVSQALVRVSRMLSGRMRGEFVCVSIWCTRSSRAPLVELNV